MKIPEQIERIRKNVADCMAAQPPFDKWTPEMREQWLASNGGYENTIRQWQELYERNPDFECYV